MGRRGTSAHSRASCSPPATSCATPSSTAALVADQLKTFKQRLKGVNLSYAKRKNLTPYDVLIIASMIEAESATEHDRPLVAAVIYNRLAKGMPLQIDATTRYATGNYSKPLTESELNSQSPYNTRIHKGLPPTPIGNPGMASIEAAAHPANKNYLYFVVKPCGNGEQTFTASYSAVPQGPAAIRVGPQGPRRPLARALLRDRGHDPPRRPRLARGPQPFAGDAERGA